MFFRRRGRRNIKNKTNAVDRRRERRHRVAIRLAATAVVETSRRLKGRSWMTVTERVNWQRRVSWGKGDGSPTLFRPVSFVAATDQLNVFPSPLPSLSPSLTVCSLLVMYDNYIFSLFMSVCVSSFLSSAVCHFCLVPCTCRRWTHETLTSINAPTLYTCSV